MSRLVYPVLFVVMLLAMTLLPLSTRVSASSSLERGRVGDESCATIEEIGGIEEIDGIESDWQTISISGTHLYAAGESGLVVYDVTNPVSPTVEYGYGSTPVWDIEVADSLVYVVGGAEHKGLRILDFSNYPRQVLRGAYIVSTFEEVGEVDVVGDRAYLTVSSKEDFEVGLLILDVSHPENPTLLGSYRTEGSYVLAAVVGDVVYLSGHYGDPGSGYLQILDVSDPARVQPVKRLDASVYVELEAEGDSLYAAGAASKLSGLDIFNVSDPVNPVRVRIRQSGTWGGYSAVEYESPFVYGVYNSQRGSSFSQLELYNTRTEYSVPCASYRIPDTYVQEIEVEGERVYLIDSYFQKIRILQVSPTTNTFNLALPLIQR